MTAKMGRLLSPSILAMTWLYSRVRKPSISSMEQSAMPRGMICFSSPRWGLNFRKRRLDFPDRKYRRKKRRLPSWASPVARAAPKTPQCQTMMKR